MKESVMFNNLSSTSLSLEDLTSLSSISSLESTSIYSSNHSTVSSCNESRLLRKNKSLPKINCDLENILASCSLSPPPSVAQQTSSSSSSSSSSLSALINERIRQKMKMLNIHPKNPKKNNKKVTFNNEQLNGKTVNVEIVRKTSEKQSISHKVPSISTMESTQVKKIIDNQFNNKNHNLVHLINSSNPNESIPVNPSDISSVSSIEIAPSTIKQFKYMIEKQKSYLDCLQRELNRLQRMEAVLTELHHKSELQKGVINDTLISDCCTENNNNHCACHSSPSKQNNESQQETNPVQINSKPSKPESVEDFSGHLSDISAVESTVSVTPTNQTSYENVNDSASVSRLTNKRETMNSIHAQIDSMIFKLHEETVIKHSIGVQTSDSFNDPPTKSYQIESTKTKKCANNKLTNKPNNRETHEQSVAWSVIIPEENLFKQSTRNTNKGEAYYLAADEQDLTLQQAFRLRCGQFLARSQSRVREINMASAIRKATAESRLERQLEEFILRNQLQHRDNYNYLIGHHPIKVKVIKPRKIFTEKEMKKQTERLYSHLPEMQKLKEAKRREENVKTHRLMAKNFSQKLKNKAIEGKITFPITQRLTNY